MFDTLGLNIQNNTLTAQTNTRLEYFLRLNRAFSNVDICMMRSFDYNYQNALRQAIAFGISSFVKNRSCVTQICITRNAFW